MFSMLRVRWSTRRGQGRAGEVPRDPLTRVQGTVAKLLDAFRIALHVEFRDDDILEFD